MNINTKIDGKDVTITLTKDQLKEIARQTNQLSIENIDYSSACKLLGREERTASDYFNTKELATHKIETIIEAVNYLDNGNKIWKPEFDSHKASNYIPYFERKDGSWVVSCVCVYCWASFCSVGLYFKKQESARTIANKFLDLYNQYLG